MCVYKSVAESMVTNAHHIINSALAGSRSPAGPRHRRKRTHAIGMHPFSPVVLSVAILPAAQDRAVAGGREGPCFAVCALVCDPLSRAECVPTFARESKRGPFVREVEKRDENRFGTALWR